MKQNNKYVKDVLGRKIKKENAVEINGIFYNKKKQNPPLVVKFRRQGWVLFNNKKHYFYEPEGRYYNIDDMIKYIDKNRKETSYPSLEHLQADRLAVDFRSICLTTTNVAYADYKMALEDGFNFVFGQKKLYKNGEEGSKDDIKYRKYNNSKISKRQFPKKSEAIKYGVFSPTFKGTGGMKYTFGVEIETCRGYIPEYIYHNDKLNMDSTYDGSLKDPCGTLYGGEYVTGVLTGDAGLKNLYNCVKTINKFCKIDKRCGIHVHIGNANFTDTFTVLAYKLALSIENEIMEIFPPSRRKNEFANPLKKYNFKKIFDKHGFDYGVEIIYDQMFRDMANGRKLDKNVNKFQPHPGGRYTDRYSQGIPMKKLFRYMWLNFIPCNFNTRSVPPDKKSKLNRGIPFTLEFRPHSASMNYTKIRNWVLFCMAFVNFVENHQKYIIENENITVNDIITKSIKDKTISDRLVSYFHSRKEKFKGKKAVKEEQTEYSEVVEHKASTYKEII